MERDDWHLLKRYFEGKCSPEEVARVPAVFTTAAGRQVFSELLRSVDPRTDVPTLPDGATAYEHFERRLAERNHARIISQQVPTPSQKRGGFSSHGLEWDESWRSAVEAKGLLVRRPLRRGLWIAALSVLIGAMIILNHHGSEPYHNVEHVYATHPYQQGIVNLADGTRVILAPKTTLRVLQFGTHSRTVILENGEAYFEIAKVSGAPFIVRSGSVAAQVLGTAFLFRHDVNDQHVHVAVAEGKVRVTTPARADTGITLTMGQVGDVTDSTAQVSTVDGAVPGIEQAPGRIMFRYTPLATVLQTISRWYGYQFRYADQTLGARTVTIMISTQSSAQALAAIERVLAVNLTVVGDTVTLVPQSSRSNPRTPRIRTYDIWTPAREVGR